MKEFKDQIKEALSLIERSGRILLVPSSPVDGDAIGSTLALRLILKKMGKDVTINYSFDHFSHFKFLPGAETIRVLDLFVIDFSKFDLAIFLDGGNLEQFYDKKVHRESFVLPDHPPVLNIDHHPTNTRFAPFLVYSQEVSSTAEIIYKMFNGRVAFEKDLAVNLFAGISTDTGHFRHPNTRPEVLRLAADLLSFGFDLGSLVVNLYFTSALKTVLFSGYLAKKIKVNQRLSYSYFCLSLKEWQKEGLSFEEMKEAVARSRDYLLRSVDGVDFSFSLVEEKEGYVSGSLRGRRVGLFDLSKLATVLGGGGHAEAAGFSIGDQSLAEAEKLVHRKIEEYYGQIKL